jgi:hypothetical protein
MTNRLSKTLLIAALVLAYPAIGCGPGIIDDSPVVADDADIPDTAEHRAIVELIEVYRRALEDKDVGSLRQIISSDYYENAGTSHTTSDDYGYDHLTEVLETYAESVRQLRLSVIIRQIEIQGSRANVYVDYGYNMLYVIDGQERWQVDRDLNRLELVREGSVWRVVAGL